MRHDGPSRTAIGVAIQRAAHQVLDSPPVFADPFAARMVGPRARAVLETAPHRLARSPFVRYLRAALAARSRVAEEALAAAVARGVRQYVVLGAGLDTFALRNANPALRVFEVDHPATQTWKLRQLRREGIAIPANVTFVAVDFERDDLAAALRAAGLAPGEPSFFSWLGVTPYLEPGPLWATLRAVAAAAGGAGGVAFDFIARPRRREMLVRLILWLRGRRVASLGEPFRTLMRPDDVAAGLEGLGFRDVVVLGPAQLNARFFAGRADGLRVGSVTYVAVATDATGGRASGASPGSGVV